MTKKLKKKPLVKREASGNVNIKSQEANRKKPETGKKYLPLFIILALGVLTFIAYQPALDNEFVDWDDYTYVIENNLVSQQNSPEGINELFSTPVSLNYHPVTILTMHWNNNVCTECPNGISPEPFIKWNIILHIINAIMVFFLAFSLSGRNWFAGIFCSAVFALHPMHVESVAWVSERKDVLYVFFFLAGLLFYNRYLNEMFSNLSKGQYKWLAAAFVCYLLSCLSKAMAVSFPLVMMLMYFWKDKTNSNFGAFKNTFNKKRLLEFLPFFAAAIFFGLMAVSVQSGKDFGGLLRVNEKTLAVSDFKTFSIFQRFQFAAYGFCIYIYKFFVPSGFSALHPYPSQTSYDNNPIYLLSLIGFIVLLAGTALTIKRTRLIIFGMGFYFFTVVLVLQFISVGVAITADRYTYLPFVGLSFMLALLIEKLPQKIRYVAYGLAGIVCVVWIKQTRNQTDKWQNSDTIWTQVIEKYPNAEQAYSIRGNYYGKLAGLFIMKGDTAMQHRYINKAEQDFNKAIQLQSASADVYEGMGNIQGMKGNRNEALKLYSRAIELNPVKSTSYINRGITYDMSGNYTEALKDFSKAIELDPKPVSFLYRGMLKEKTGDREGAKADYRSILQVAPKHNEAAKRLRALGG